MEKKMNKLTLALAGASVAITGLAATPASAADFGRHDRGQYQQVQTRQVVQNRFVQNDRFVGTNRFVGNSRFVDNNRSRSNRSEGRRWQRGERFDRNYATNYAVISNPYAYNLQQAPYGYRWVRSGNDAVLVAIASGIIGSLIGNAF
jgi:Ni/Co efflux regulator RcnB